MAITGPGDGGLELSTNMSLGSTTVVQISRNALFESRFFSTICAGPCGSGKRSDSLNVRLAFLASSVVSHSPKIDANPREYRSRFVARSRTSNKYLPKFVSSTVFCGLPGHGAGSITTLSTLKISRVAVPVW